MSVDPSHTGREKPAVALPSHCTSILNASMACAKRQPVFDNVYLLMCIAESCCTASVIALEHQLVTCSLLIALYFSALFVGGGAKKALSKIIGMDIGPSRLPVKDPSDEKLQAMREEVEQLGIKDFI